MNPADLVAAGAMPQTHDGNGWEQLAEDYGDAAVLSAIGVILAQTRQPVPLAAVRLRLSVKPARPKIIVPPEVLAAVSELLRRPGRPCLRLRQLARATGGDYVRALHAVTALERAGRARQVQAIPPMWRAA